MFLSYLKNGMDLMVKYKICQLITVCDKLFISYTLPYKLPFYVFLTVCDKLFVPYMLPYKLPFGVFLTVCDK